MTNKRINTTEVKIYKSLKMSDYGEHFEDFKEDKRSSRNSKWNLYKNSLRFVNQTKASKSQEKLDENLFKNRRRCGSLGDVSKLSSEDNSNSPK